MSAAKDEHAAALEPPCPGMNLVMVDGQPDWFDPESSVWIQSGDTWHSFDWFPGCEVWTSGDGSIEVTERQEED